MYDLIKDGDIDLSPSFQRNLVWGPKTEVPSYRVDSVEDSLTGLLFRASDEEGLLSVVDGLQRLSAIRDFMDNKFVRYLIWNTWMKVAMAGFIPKSLPLTVSFSEESRIPR